MRRRISLLLATVLAAAGFAVLGPSQPATAWIDCGDTGTATVGTLPGPAGTGMLYPIGFTTPSKTPGLVFDVLLGEGNPIYFFSFAFGFPSTCMHNETYVDPATANATGLVKGYCGLSSGSGSLANGALFAWIGVGPILFITGHLDGVLHVTPDPTIAGNSCTHNGSLAAGALTFIVTGDITILNCDAALQTLVPGTPEDFTTLFPLITNQHLNFLFHALVDFGLHFYWNHLCFGSPVL